MVTGSAGHLGEALVRALRERGETVLGFDLKPSAHTDVVASLIDRDQMARAVAGVDHVLHTTTLHNPHVASHSRQASIDVNVTGTLAVLEASAAASVRSVVFTSSTSAFGRALTPAPGEPAVWITEDVADQVRNIYGATKTAAENLCELAACDGLPVIVLRTSRFFPEPDDRDDARARYHDANFKAVEYLYRRVDLSDAVEAHLLAARRAPELGLRPLHHQRHHPVRRTGSCRARTRRPGRRRQALRRAGRAVHHPRLDHPTGHRLDLRQHPSAPRIWTPRWAFPATAELALDEGHVLSPLAGLVGAKGYHERPTGISTR